MSELPLNPTGGKFEKTLKSAKDILTHILQTEEELKLFCESNNINTKNQHIFTLGKFFRILKPKEKISFRALNSLERLTETFLRHFETF